MKRASQTHPFFTRLFLDLDPAGNPIGRGAIAYENGTETATLWFTVPGPFDSILDAWSELVTEWAESVGEQLELF
jgi:hypothetical protein